MDLTVAILSVKQYCITNNTTIEQLQAMIAADLTAILGESVSDSGRDKIVRHAVRSLRLTQANTAKSFIVNEMQGDLRVAIASEYPNKIEEAKVDEFGDIVVKIYPEGRPQKAAFDTMNVEDRE